MKTNVTQTELFNDLFPCKYFGRELVVNNNLTR